MKIHKILAISILAGLLLVALGLAGCVAPAATPTPTGQPSGIAGYLPIIIILVLIFAMFYFLMVRPMRQREKKHDEMVSQLQVGDRVLTATGMYGQIERIDENSIVLKVESGATIRFTKGAILSRVEVE